MAAWAGSTLTVNLSLIWSGGRTSVSCSGSVPKLAEVPEEIKEEAGEMLPGPAETSIFHGFCSTGSCCMTTSSDS